jgi:protein-S-isoprenylcysteine O-methyltransferase Ste14
MNRFLTLGYGALSYVIFLAAFLYAIGFVGNLVVPRSIDHGVEAPIGEAVAVNVLMLGLFAVQHSVMARPAFKHWWTRLVPKSIERSTYVLLSSLVLLLMFWQWRTMPAVFWNITWPPGRIGLRVLFWLGWATVLASTFMISHFDLFGLRQVSGVACRAIHRHRVSGSPAIPSRAAPSHAASAGRQVSNASLG